MTENRRSLNQTGQVGLLVLVGSMTVATFSAGPIGLIELFCGILGFYLLTHQDCLRKERPPPKTKKEGKGP